jgi:hypothetical protein
VGVGPRWLVVAALLALPTGVAVASASTTPAAGASADPTPVEVLSGESMTLRTVSDLRATVTGAATTAQGRLVVGGACPSTPAATLVDLDPASPDLGAVTATAAPLVTPDACQLSLSVDVPPRAAATGLMVVDDEGRVPAAVAVTVERTSSFQVFGLLAVVGVVAGVVGAFGGHRGAGGKQVPKEWKLDDAYVTTLTAVAAAAIPLLEATDVLTAYAPQYSTAGVLALGFGVAVLLALAPLTFVTLGASRWAFALASGITVAGAVAQVLSVALVVVSGALPDWSRWVALAAAAVLGLVVTASPWLQAGRFVDEGASSADLAAGPSASI